MSAQPRRPEALEGRAVCGRPAPVPRPPAAVRGWTYLGADSRAPRAGLRSAAPEAARGRAGTV